MKTKKENEPHRAGTKSHEEERPLIYGMSRRYREGMNWDNFFGNQAYPASQICLCGGYICPQISRTELKTALLKYEKYLYIHCPLITFCNLSQPHCVNNSRRTIADHLKIIKNLPAAAVVHIGKVGQISDVVEQLDALEIEAGTYQGFEKQLLMENAAGQGSELGRTWNQLRKLFESIDDTSGIGLCIDTQHAFAAGMADPTTHEGAIKMYEKAESIMKIGLIHLNDSKKPFGSRVDRHQNLRQGYIWSEDDEGLETLFSLCEEKGLPLMLETPNPFRDIRILEKRFAPEEEEEEEEIERIEKVPRIKKEKEEKKSISRQSSEGEEEEEVAPAGEEEEDLLPSGRQARKFLPEEDLPTARKFLPEEEEF